MKERSLETMNNIRIRFSLFLKKKHTQNLKEKVMRIKRSTETKLFLKVTKNFYPNLLRETLHFHLPKIPGHIVGECRNHNKILQL